jgi:hypothetical protein
MNPFARLFRSRHRKASSRPRQAKRPRARLNLEGLETRLVPSQNVFVVPLSQPSDSFHFYNLSDAVPVAGTGGVVTIEPGASPDSVKANTDGVTIQGDPNVPASILPSEQLIVTANNVKLVNLNIGSLTLGDPNLSGQMQGTGAQVSKCLIYTLTDYFDGTQISQNTITGSVSIVGRGGGNVFNNTFTSTGFPTAPQDILLNLNSINAEAVFQNTFYGDNRTPSGIGIEVFNSGASVSNNKIVLSFGVGIDADQTGNNTCGVFISENTISTNTGIGLRLTTHNGTDLQATVRGNDFHNNAIGVSIAGDINSDSGNIDLGTPGSVGGNDFRGFTGQATATSAAILVINAGNGIGGTGTPIPAEENMFPSGMAPSQAIFVFPASTGAIDASLELSDQRSFVEVLYNNLLGRTGTLAELDGWVTVLNSQGQATVVNGILRSTEALGRIVDSLYLRFLGRQSDAAGKPGWINALQHGATLESIETAFLTAPEYLHHINTDYVQSLYINILGRTGSATELAFWDNQVQSIGLAGIANAFVLSQEYRNDNVIGDFQTFLHRSPKANELSAFAGLPTDFLGLEAAVLNTQEAFVNG